MNVYVNWVASKVGIKDELNVTLMVGSAIVGALVALMWVATSLGFVALLLICAAVFFLWKNEREKGFFKALAGASDEVAAWALKMVPLAYRSTALAAALADGKTTGTFGRSWPFFWVGDTVFDLTRSGGELTIVFGSVSVTLTDRT